jgi:hypothetical protein
MNYAKNITQANKTVYRCGTMLNEKHTFEAR